jgi:hypothetical protein
MNKQTDDQLRELKRLRDASLIIINFCWQSSDQEVAPLIFGNLRNVVNQTYEEGNLRGMRIIFGDMTEMSKGMRKEQIDSLNHILKKEFGVDLYNNKKKVDAILAKGVIKNRSDYKLVFDYLEEIYADESKTDEIAKVNHLLEEYQRKVGKV